MSIPNNLQNDAIVEPGKVTKITHRKQVVVVGGGSAGAAAAISAARNGADTLLIERFGSLGGTFSGGLMNHGESRHAFHDRIPHDQPVIRGLYEEIIERCKKLNGFIEEYKLKEQLFPYVDGVDVFSPEILKYVLFQMARESELDLLLHSIAVEAVLHEKELCGVIIENKSGRQAILGEVFIDCTGDADLSAMAMVPYEQGREEDGKLQPATLTFRIGNVDIERLMNYYGADKPIEVGMKADEFRSKHPFKKEIHRARENGDLSIPREDLTFHLTPLKGVLYFNATRVHGVDGTDADSITRGEIVGREQVMELFLFCRKYLKGCEKAFLIDTGNHIGLRETRRIVGDYVVTSEDILTGKQFEDAIAKSAQRVDEHSPDGSTTRLETLKAGQTFQVPYRCLVPKIIDRLLVAGRCVSATRHGQAALRMVPICMAMGQAAGIAAALAVSQNTKPRDIDISLLQQRLLHQGAVI